MSGSVKVLSWNLQGEIGIGGDRLQRQLDFLTSHTGDIDLFFLRAVNSEEGTPGNWDGHLGGLLDHFSSRDYHVVHTGDWAQELAWSSVQPHADIAGSHNRCNLSASRWPIECRLSLRNEADGYPARLNYYYSHFPEKILVGSVDLEEADETDIDVLESWNVGIVNGAGWGDGMNSSRSTETTSTGRCNLSSYDPRPSGRTRSSSSMASVTVCSSAGCERVILTRYQRMRSSRTNSVGA